jgi:hypothetical protein
MMADSPVLATKIAAADVSPPRLKRGAHQRVLDPFSGDVFRANVRRGWRGRIIRLTGSV